ncbi:MAG: polyprenyl synthetase family protein [Chitinophagales bacterium]
MKEDNISDRRFEEMKETFRLIKPEMRVMEKLLSKYQLFEQDDLPAYCFELLNRRWKKNILPQRAYFLRKIYEYILWEQGVEKPDAQLEELFKVKLGFIMEVTIVIQYLHNQIIDEKFDVKNIAAVRRNLIASNILREILFQYIQQEIEGYGHEIKQVVEKSISNILLHVDLGQRLEQEYNHYDSYKKNPPLSICQTSIGLFSDLDCIRPIIESIKGEIPQKIDFIEVYFRRIYLTNGCFYTFMTQLVLNILGYKDESKKEDLSNFAVIFGVATQITNDIVDFVPPIKNNGKNLSSNTVGKNSTDSYSDLKNGNITLPLIYHLSKNQQRLIENYLSKPTKPNDIDNYSLEVTKEILKSRAIQKAKKVGQNIANLADNYLNIKNPSASLIMDIIEKTKWNKYYYELNKIEKTK